MFDKIHDAPVNETNGYIDIDQYLTETLRVLLVIRLVNQHAC